MASQQGTVIDYGIYAYTEYDIIYTDTQVILTVNKAIAKTSKNNIGVNNISGEYSGTDQTTSSVTGKSMRNSADVTIFEGFIWTWNKGETASAPTIIFSVSFNGKSSIITFSIDVPALISYSIEYRGNGSPSRTALMPQTKYFNKPLTLRSTNAYTAPIGYTSTSNWNTKKDGSGTTYASGGTYEANESAVLYAQWSPRTFTVTFNPNNGTANTTTNIDRTYGTSFTIPSTAIPTRTNYTFLGWDESSGATTATYIHSGGTSGTCVVSAFNSVVGNKILYAIWKEKYIAPIISDLTVTRVNSSDEEDNEGTRLKVNIKYTPGRANSSAAYEGNTSIQIKRGTTIIYTGSQSATDANQSYSTTLTDITYETTSTYTLTVTLTTTNNNNTYGTATKTTIVSTSIYPIDLISNGTNVYMGVMHPAVNGQVLTLPNNTKVDGDITATSLNGITIPTSLSFTDTKVTVSAVTPSTSTNYYPVFRTPTAGQNVGLPTSETIDLKANAYIRFQILQGTTSAEGKSQILLGNGNATGTNANSKGYITMYTASTGYTTLGCANHTGSVSITFPAQAGTVALTSQLHSHNYYSGTWTATSSAATNVQLTDELTLPAGTYLIVVNSPYVNTANLTVALSINNSNTNGYTTDAKTTCTFRSGAYTQSCNILQLVLDSTIKLVSQSSTSVSLTNTERGGIKAVHLS